MSMLFLVPAKPFSPNLLGKLSLICQGQVSCCEFFLIALKNIDDLTFFFHDLDTSDSQCSLL